MIQEILVLGSLAYIALYYMKAEQAPKAKHSYEDDVLQPIDPTRYKTSDEKDNPQKDLISPDNTDFYEVANAYVKRTGHEFETPAEHAKHSGHQESKYVGDQNFYDVVNREV